MSGIERRLTNLEETLAPAVPPRLVFANSKAHAERLVTENKAERAKNPSVARGQLIIVRWLESKESAADYHDPAATENSRGWQQ